MVRLHAMTPLPFRRLCLDTRQRPPRERLRCVLGMLSNLEVKVLWPT